MMIDFIIEKTKEFLEAMPKSVRKKKGQFFTSKETALFMAEMFDFSQLSRDIVVLDPGTGTGILSAALLERLQRENIVDSVKLICYETDSDVLPLLRNNMESIKGLVTFTFEYQIIEDDYIISQAEDFEGTLLASSDPTKYDLIIGNPPYLRVMRDNPAAVAMPTVVHGAPNLYFLFASMSLFNLKDSCEMVYIIPRSWTSGAYFRAFREYFLTQGKLIQIHLFVSRDKVFSQESVLQETIILKIKKTQNAPMNVLLTSSQSNSDFNSVTQLMVPYDDIVIGRDLYVILPTSPEDIEVVQQINRYSQTFPEIGVRMRTGIVVDFRQWEDLRTEPDEHTFPLFYSQHIRDGRVSHTPSGKEYDWVSDDKPSLTQRNKDYVFCKRFTAKEERRRLQCGIYLSADFPEYEKIGTQNKINFVERVDGYDLTTEEIYGIFAILNSTLFDQYYRILNGSTQVNSTEINSIPVPSLCMLKTIGEYLMGSDSLTTESCDRILKEVAYG